MPIVGRRSYTSVRCSCCCNRGSENHCNGSTDHRKYGRRKSRVKIASLALLLLLSASCIETASPFTIPPITSPTPSSNSATTAPSLVAKGKESQLLSSTSADSEKKVAPSDTFTSKVDRQISELKKRQAVDVNAAAKKQRKRPYYKPKRKPYRRGVATRCSRNQNRKRRIRYLYSKARSLEKRGMWREASEMLKDVLEIEPKDAHSYLALARLESRREWGGRVGRIRGDDEVGEGRDEKNSLNDSDAGEEKEGKKVQGAGRLKYKDAREIFQIGTTHCPESVHLYHAWGMHEQSLGNIPKAKQLFEKALDIDPWNGYVCHAYGLLEMQQGSADSDVENKGEGRQGGGEKPKDQGRDPFGNGGNNQMNAHHIKRARQLWQRGLTYQPSAALVCSLGQLYTTSGHPDSARELYSTYIPRMTSARERIEVYLAASSLEETTYNNVERASELLKEALSGGELYDGRPYVALAMLGARGGSIDDLVVMKRLKKICTEQMKQRRVGGKRGRPNPFPVKDGRLFNAWAKLESKSNLTGARRILRKGIWMYPKDHTLLQAAGNIEERLGNVTAARDLYSASLHLEPSAPALISYAMLELRSPEAEPNVTMVRKLFDEALLIDPKHGPVYNAYGNLERKEGNADRARQLYEDGINANCTDAPSVYHGLSKLHLSLGELEEARGVLRRGLALFCTSDDKNACAPPQRNENVAFLAHTLAMIELNCNHNAIAAKSALKQGLSHCHNSPQLLLAMALCESACGNEKAARAMFEKSLRADQRHAQAWQAFGVFEMKAGNWRTAKTLFDCGLKNSPTHGALWQAYGTLESWKGNVSRARVLFAAGIEKCPQHVPLYQAWACLELRCGDVTTAKRLIGEALTRDKRNGSGWLLAAKIEQKMDNHGLVGLILRRGIECAPGDMELYRALADHEISRGRIDSARELLERGIEINPLYAPLYHSLAELEARIFNIEGLARLNKRTAEIFPSNAMAPPPPQRMQAWGEKLKQQGRTAKIPEGIAALAEKIGVDGDTNMRLDDIDPASLVSGFGSGDDSLMFEFQEDL